MLYNLRAGICVAFACALTLASTLPASAAPSHDLSPGSGAILSPSQQKAVISTASVLDELLAKTAEYAAKLESSVLNFVCREEIRETIDPSLESDERRRFYNDLLQWERVPPPAVLKIENTYVYDYQCVRSGRTIHEERILLKENGRLKHVSNAVLNTSVVVFETPLMWPVGVFSERFQPDYDFAVVRWDAVRKHPVIVIDVRPKPGAPEARCPYGKAWVDPASADILRVEWDESRVGGYEVFAKRGARYGRTPRLTIRSEFSTEKNGIRFPSHLVIEEAYLRKLGRPFVRSRTEVTYKDFKFFTVEVEVGR